MGNYPLAQGIRFNDCVFSEPCASRVDATRCAGLFAILVTDPIWAPKALQPIYFGEFGNNVAAVALLSDYPSLLRAAKGNTLLVCVLPMPFTTTAQRWAARNELVWAYNPVCKRTSVRRHRATPLIGFVEPQPEPPRRRIGFLPQSNRLVESRSLTVAVLSEALPKTASVRVRSKGY